MKMALLHKEQGDFHDAKIFTANIFSSRIRNFFGDDGKSENFLSMTGWFYFELCGTARVVNFYRKGLKFKLQGW
jgi:hypothetical protein